VQARLDRSVCSWPGMAGILQNLFGGSTGGSVPPRTGTGAAGSQPSYSFARLQQLYDRLSKFRESDLEKGGDKVVEVVETVRQITEVLIWGEQNDTHFFDFFCEKNILADFVKVIGLPKAPTAVKLQLLQTLSILVLNVRNETSVYYLLSNNHINRLIKTPLNFEDEEILPLYITFIKSLAMRLDKETVKFFFLQYPEPTFHLYVEATRFFDNRDQMVRTAVRTITLQVYRIDDKLVRRFVLLHAAESYFSQLAYHLRDLWLRLDAAASGAKEQQDLSAIQREHELQQDLLVYLSDVFELRVDELTEVLADRLLNCAMLPVLLKGVLAVKAHTAIIDGHQRVLMPSVALFLIRQVFDIIRVPCLLEPLASALVQPSIPVALAYVLPQGISPTSASSPSNSEEDYSPNWLREHFLDCLQSSDDAVFLLSASVLHGILRRAEDRDLGKPHDEQSALQADGGDSAGVTSDGSHTKAQLVEVERDEVAGSTSVAMDVCSGAFADCKLDVYLTMLQALDRHPMQHPETLAVFVRIVSDILFTPLVLSNVAARNQVWRALHSASQATACRLKELMFDCMRQNDCGDGILDIFFDEWELQRTPLPEVARFCGDPQRLLPASVWSSPSQQRGARPPCTAAMSSVCHGADEASGRVLRAFLLARRMLAGFPQSEKGSSVPDTRMSTIDEPVPVTIEASGNFREGESFDFGAFGRIVCGVPSTKGRCTRYLLLHDYWFMLVAPDATAPGWAIVKTLCPIWQVQSLVDRGDPRTLQVFLHARTVQVYSGDAYVDRRGAGRAETTCVLNFEDVRRCHAANEHLDGRRQKIRVELMQKLAMFVGKCADDLQVLDLP